MHQVHRLLSIMNQSMILTNLFFKVSSYFENDDSKFFSIYLLLYVFYYQILYYLLILLPLNIKILRSLFTINLLILFLIPMKSLKTILRFIALANYKAMFLKHFLIQQFWIYKILKYLNFLQSSFIFIKF
jgi:hypothetical protein